MQPKLIAPKPKVVSFLRQILADGERLAAETPTTLAECYAASEERTRWTNWAGQVLRRAFDDQPFWLAMHENPKDMPAWPDLGVSVEFLSAYGAAAWRHKLAQLRKAIAAAEASR